MIEMILEQNGGKSGEDFDNSLAFKNAFEKIRNSGGGVLRVAKGIWKTGPIELFSNTELALSEGAHIVFIPEFERYTPVWTRWEGVECYGMHPCVFANGAENVKVTGKGIIDGSGKTWWQVRESKRKQKGPETEIEKQFAALNPDYLNQPGGGGGRNIQFLRPPLVQFFKCKNALLEGVTVTMSPFWSVHPVFCDNLRIQNISVISPHDSCNTDGIDIDSCEHVEITGCNVSVGDDGIALKSGSGDDGIKAGKPTSHVTVKDCTVGDGHGGIVIGSETAAGVNTVYVENCVFKGTDRGIRIKTRRGRGGKMFGMTFKNLKMIDNLCPLAVNMYYVCGVNSKEDPSKLFSLFAQPVNAQTPSISDITIEGIYAEGCKASAGFIAGLPENPVTNLRIKNCVFKTNENSGVEPSKSDMFAGITETTEKSFRIINAVNPEFVNVTVEGPKNAFIFE